jgi:hypothetical protein
MGTVAVEGQASEYGCARVGRARRGQGLDSGLAWMTRCRVFTDEACDTPAG